MKHLRDVVIATPADGEVLTYDSADEKWKNEAGGGGGVTDHGALTGLADDDHPQYETTAEVAAQIGTHNADTTAVHGIADTSLLATDADLAAHVAATSAELDAHVTDASGAHAASAIAFTPAGDVAADDVQEAIEELDTDKAAVADLLTPDDVTLEATGSSLQVKPGGIGAIQIDLGDQIVMAGTFAAIPAAGVDGRLYLATDVDGGTLYRDSGAAWVQASPGVAEGGWTTVTKAADESVASSTTTQNDDELFFTAVSGAQYEFELVLIYGSPAGGGTPDLKFDLGEDATARGSFFVGAGFGASDTAVNAVVLCNQTSVGFAGTAVADRISKSTGAYTGGGGTFRLRWAQNTSGLNATIVRAGSLLRYRRVL